MIFRILIVVYSICIGIVFGSNLGYHVLLNQVFKHGDRLNELNGGLCSQFKLLNGIDQCCAGRIDECYMIHYDTRCYCDTFCERSETDCCEDAYDECRGGTPIIFTTTTTTTTRSHKGECVKNGKIYRDQEVLKENCNELRCDNGRWIGNEVKCLIDVELMKNINSKGTSWVAGNYSKFWGKTLEFGYQHRLGTQLPSNLQRPFDPYKTYRITFLDKKLDETYDFRDILKREGIQRADYIRDQGDCAASWAFSTIDVATDRLIKISKGRFGNSNYSVQQLLSCAKSPNGDGCTPHTPYYAWNYLNHITPDAGLVQESCYPYQNSNSTVANECKINTESIVCPSNGAKYEKNHYSMLLASPVYNLKVLCDADIMREIIMQGPVQAVFRVYPDLFMYKSGVYKWSGENHDQKAHYHSVKILGWGTEKGENYWLCANSWGSDWGEQGYFKIKRGDSEINNNIYAAWGNGKINDKVIYNSNVLKRYVRQMYAAIKNL